MIKLYHAKLMRKTEDSSDEWDEILLDRLISQKVRLAYVAHTLESNELSKWVEEWSLDDVKIPSIDRVAEGLQKEFQANGVPDAISDFIIYGAIQLKHALETFMSGKFEDALKQSFAIEYHIGVWGGIHKASKDRGKEQQSPANLADKKIVLNYKFFK